LKEDHSHNPAHNPGGQTISGPFTLRRLDTWLRLSRLTYRVPAHGSSLFFTLGGIVFAGFLLMIATGFVLAQLYNPIPPQAYQSLQKIQQIGWARYIRALHYWTAQGIIAALLLHICRVFITGAYKHPRQVTWWLGVALFGVMLMGSYFSGTVLKWDEEGLDALNHYKEALGYLGPLGALLTGAFPGSGPINFRIYVSHIAVFPVLLVLLIVAHFYLIRIFNLSPTPRSAWANSPEIPQEEMKGRFNEHAQSIAVYSLIYYGFLAIVAFFIPAPLGGAPAADHGPLKPPWPFLWVYGFENIWGVVAVLFANAVLFGFLALVPLLDRKQDRSTKARRGILLIGGVVAISLVGLTLHGWFTPPQTHTHGHGEEAAHEEDGHSHPEEGEMMGPSDGEVPHEEDGHSHDEAPSAQPKESDKEHPHPPGTPDHVD
jgi:quinol-cytochrome oxidoreductase complex cytochrome b subunit